MAEEGRDRIGDPMESARRLAAPPRQKRFYERVTMPKESAVHILRLDGKRAMTPGRKPLAVPSERLAGAIVSEWEAQRETIDPLSMPVTRLANSAIDGVADRMEEVRRDVVSYAESDLLYYRAESPEGLVRRQNELWDPILVWAARAFIVRFNLAGGVMHVAQPEETTQALAALIDTFDEPFRLAGLHLATTLTGSALISLALSHGEQDADSAWAAAHVDEDWNISQWGEDAEAAERRARRLADFRASALALAAR
jgi:chaperone required for assembly of F1-ATPase